MPEEGTPLGLPKGSIHALIALLLVATFILTIFFKPDQVEAAAGASMFVVGYYFGKRGGA